MNAQQTTFCTGGVVVEIKDYVAVSPPHELHI